MGIVDWQCCKCYHTFQAHTNQCPKCGHWINWSHNHTAIKIKRKVKPKLWRVSLDGLSHIKNYIFHH